MKLNSPLRRTATVLAGALIGLTGITVAAGPASAHSTNVTGVAYCDTATGTRTVTWTVTNDWGTDATVADLATTPNAVTDLQNGTVIPKAGYQVFLHDPVGTKLEFNFPATETPPELPSGTSAKMQVHEV